MQGVLKGMGTEFDGQYIDTVLVDTDFGKDGMSDKVKWLRPTRRPPEMENSKMYC